MVPPRGPVLLRHRVDRPQGAPTLVLGGSLGSTLEMWSLQMPALSETLRVVRYHHRGPGGTPAPPGPYTIGDLGGDVLAVLDLLGIARQRSIGCCSTTLPTRED